MLTVDEYWFLTNSPCLSPKLYNSVGESCYAEGYIDDFGFVTPKGKEAIKAFIRPKTSLPYDIIKD